MNLLRCPVRIISAAAFFSTRLENTKSPTEIEMEKDVQRVRMKESGWNRVKEMFYRDEYGNLSDEMASVLNSCISGGIIGAFYGGWLRSKTVYIEFMEQNQATAFKSHLDAKKALQDRITLSYGKGAFGVGWRSALFCGLFVLTCNTVELYRGKSGVIEYFAAGAFVGSMFRTHLGLSGMIVGGGLGAVLGTTAGVLINTVLWVCGSSIEDWKSWNRQWRESRSSGEKAAFAEVQRKEEIDPMLVRKIESDEKEKRLLDTLSTIERLNKTKQAQQVVTSSEDRK